MATSNFSNWDAEAQDIERRRRYADALRGQSMEPLDTNQNAGGYVVPISPFQGLTKMFQAYTGSKLERKASEDAANLSSRRNQSLSDALRGAFEPVAGQPAQYGPFADASTTVPTGASSGLMRPAIPSRPKSTEEIAQALLGNSDTMALGGNLLVQDATSRNHLNNAMQTEKFKHQLEMDPAYIAAQRQIKTSSETPYFTPIYTPEGVMSFNNRGGGVNPLMVNGKPIMGAQYDPSVKANQTMGAEAAKEIRANYTRLRDAPAQLDNIEKTKQAVLKAGGFVGPLGETKLSLTKFLRSNVPGFGDFKTDDVTNAEELRTRLFSQIMDNLKKMDAQPSQMQQLMMMNALGNLGTDPQAIPKMLDAMGSVIQDKVKLHNATVWDAEKNGLKSPFSMAIDIKMPTSTESAPQVPSNSIDSLLEKYK